MTGVGDIVNLVRDIKGNWIAKSSNPVNVGDSVQLNRNKDGLYHASKSGSVNTGDNVIIQKSTTGKWLAHISQSLPGILSVNVYAIALFDSILNYIGSWSYSYLVSVEKYKNSFIIGGNSGVYKVNGFTGDLENSAGYSASALTVCNDYVYLTYYSSGNYYLLNVNDLSYHTTYTPSITGYVYGMCSYNNFIYVGSDQTIYKCNSSMGVASSLNIGSNIRGCCTDGTYLYVTSYERSDIYSRYRLDKRYLTDLSLVSQIFGGWIGATDQVRGCCTDGEYVYLAFHFVSSQKRKCSDLSLVAEFGHYFGSGDGANAVAVNNQFNS
jgi:hypothetical protein